MPSTPISPSRLRPLLAIALSLTLSLPALAAPRREVVEGVVAEVQLRNCSGRGTVLGFIRVVTDEGAEVSFRVLDHTLVLVQDRQGRLWVGRLDQLRVGWRCSVAHGVGDESIRDPDADNVVAQVPD